MTALVEEATEVLANTTDPAEQALLQGFIDKVGGIEEEIMSRTSLTQRQVQTTRNALTGGTAPQSKNMLERQQRVADTYRVLTAPGATS